MKTGVPAGGGVGAGGWRRRGSPAGIGEGLAGRKEEAVGGPPG